MRAVLFVGATIAVAVLATLLVGFVVSRPRIPRWLYFLLWPALMAALFAIGNGLANVSSR